MKDKTARIRIVLAVLLAAPWSTAMKSISRHTTQRSPVPKGAYATPADLFQALKADGLALVKLEGEGGREAVKAPTGKATLSPSIATAGKYELRVWMVSGEGIGPVDVAVNGNAVGRIEKGRGKPRLAYCPLRRQVGLQPGTPVITLESTNSLTISAIEIVLLPPEPIRVWSAVGVFETEKPGSEGCFQVLAPEKELDLSAEYDGMGGRKIKWQQIDTGEARFIPLLGKFRPDRRAKGIGVAYLATWVYSPSDREATLYYASDGFLQVWVNQVETVECDTCPGQDYATRSIRLRAGWNVVLAKCMKSTASWKAVFALSDSGDLRYRATPFVTTVFRAMRLKGKIKLDGVLDEEDWKSAPEIKPFWGYTTGKEAISQGVMKVLWDDTHLYIAGDLKDKDLIASFTKHDEMLFTKDDVLEFFFKPSLASTQYYEIHINPLNTTLDMMFRYPGDWKDSVKYESGLDTAVKMHGTLNNSADQDEGWSFEMRIPFAALEAAGRKAPRVGDRWSFTFCRYEYSHYLPKGYQEAFQRHTPDAIPVELSCIAKNLGKGGFHDVAYDETLEFDSAE